ncbi:DUF3422 family protein [Roseibium salinum]|nr:DUF3422 family protein [Roseibium salinum]
MAVRLELRAPHEGDQWRHHFDGSSLTVSTLEGGAAVVATDFRQDGDGLTRFLVFNHSLNDVQAGGRSSSASWR